MSAKTASTLALGRGRPGVRCKLPEVLEAACERSAHASTHENKHCLQRRHGVAKLVERVDVVEGSEGGRPQMGGWWGRRVALGYRGVRQLVGGILPVGTGGSGATVNSRAARAPGLGLVGDGPFHRVGTKSVR